MTKVYEDVKELLHDQLKKLAKKPDINATELHNIYEAVDVLKDISTIEAMEKADKEYGEYSNDYSNDYSQRQGVKGTGRYSREYSQHYLPMWAYDGNYANMSNNMSNQMRTNVSNENGMSNGDMSNNSYDYNNYSNRRGRDARTGKYVSRDYSRAEEKEHMLDRLEDMLDDANSEKERRAIEQCIQRISK